ncbi:MAG: hypothetical protein FWE59_02115 [Oscillospiraceae bacterium]|nr:hypothetical protein [Oscillospiraceae bacterium]
MKKVAFLLLICVVLSMATSCVLTIPDAPPVSSPTSDPGQETPSPTPDAPDSPTPPPSDTPTDDPPPTETGNITDPQELAMAAYTGFIEKLEATQGSHSQFDMDITMDMYLYAPDPSENMTANMFGNIKMKDFGDNIIAYSIDLDMSGMEGGSVIEIVSDGERIYCVVDGEEQSLDQSFFDEQLDFAMNIPDFAMGDMVSWSTEQVGADTETVIHLSGFKMESYLEEILGEALAELDDSIVVTYDDIEMILKTDGNSMPKSMYINIGMNLTDGTEEADLYVYYGYTYNKIGSGVEIDLSKLA